MSIDAKILICYNSPASIYPFYDGKIDSNSSKPPDMSEVGFWPEIKALELLLRNEFSEVESLPVTIRVFEAIRSIVQYDPDVIINLVEAVEGIASLESSFAGVYDLLGIPYTGSPPRTLANCLNKDFAKRVLASHDIPVPRSHVHTYGEALSADTCTLRFPVITKLLREDASIGISEHSVVSSFDALRDQITLLENTYRQDILIEEYIDGREFNLAILGGNCLPISEIDFSTLPKELPKIVTYEGKWFPESVYYQNTVPVCPAPLSEDMADTLRTIALRAFHALDCRDYARVDMRIDRFDNPYVIEVNPNPDISADSGFVRAATAAGLGNAGLIVSIAQLAYSRVNRGKKLHTAR